MIIQFLEPQVNFVFFPPLLTAFLTVAVPATSPPSQSLVSLCSADDTREKPIIFVCIDFRVRSPRYMQTTLLSFHKFILL